MLQQTEIIFDPEKMYIGEEEYIRLNLLNCESEHVEAWHHTISCEGYKKSSGIVFFDSKEIRDIELEKMKKKYGVDEKGDCYWGYRPIYLHNFFGICEDTKAES